MNVRFFIKQCTKYKNIFRNFGINVWVCKLVTIINKLTDSAANFGLGITALRASGHEKANQKSR